VLVPGSEFGRHGLQKKKLIPYKIRNSPTFLISTFFKKSAGIVRPHMDRPNYINIVLASYYSVISGLSHHHL
jgi:hypothetical protein